MPATAAADGLPAVGIDAHPLALPEGDVAYITRGGCARHAADRARALRRAVRERRLRGWFSIPAVAYDGSPSGLSADGRKLILISPRKRFPRRRTTFAVVDTRRLAVRRHIALRGDFSFDAISPDGRTMYLIQYSSRDVLQLRGPGLRPARRAAAARARRGPAGAATSRCRESRSRASRSADGRWAYTLYDNGRHSFVHALDTSRRTAVCIDLDIRKAWGARSSCAATGSMWWEGPLARWRASTPAHTR